MVINIHAGHCPDGGIGSGAVGIVKESTEARKICKATVKWLKEAGHEVHDVTVGDNMAQNGCLKELTSRCNARAAALNISIHLNSFNGSASGVETLAVGYGGIKGQFADAFLDGMTAAGFKSRGKKTTSTLYVLNHTVDPCVLVECFFCDSKTDTDLYAKLGPDAIGKIIAEAVHGATITMGVKAGNTVRVIKDQDKDELKRNPLRIRKKAGGKQVGSLIYGSSVKVLAVETADGVPYGKIGDGMWISVAADAVEVVK